MTLCMVIRLVELPFSHRRVIKVTNELNEDISYFAWFGERETVLDTSEINRTIYSVDIRTYVTLLLWFLHRHYIPAIPSGSLYHNPYGHNILKDFMCVHRAHDHSCQPFLPWGIIKCSLIP